MRAVRAVVLLLTEQDTEMPSCSLWICAQSPPVSIVASQSKAPMPALRTAKPVVDSCQATDSAFVETERIGVVGGMALSADVGT